MGARVLAIVVEIFVGLVLAGVVVGGVVPFAHGSVGPVGAALIGIATVVLVIAAGEAFRRRPSRP
jgi:CHASE2 domain-containing sensor protein